MFTQVDTISVADPLVVFFLVVLGLYTGNTCLREPYAMRFYLGICLRTPGICVGTLPTRRFREVFFLRCFAIVLLYFEADLECLGSRFVLLSRGERD